MVERWVQEEPVVLKLEVLVGLANTALAKGQELLAFGESPHGHGPFFESNRHLSIRGGGFTVSPCGAANAAAATGGDDFRRESRNCQMLLQIGGFCVVTPV